MSNIRLTGIKLPLAQLHDQQQEQAALLQAAARKTGVKATQLRDVKVVKKSLDARDKGRPAFIYTLDISADIALPGTPPPPEPQLPLLEASHQPRPVVIGAGPAGLFAAWALARAGLAPLILEQGKSLPERRADVDEFWQSGLLHPSSNIQFGEGGAGAFSDGKLTSRSKDARVALVLRLLVSCGADPGILYWHKPHLGSDKLPAIMSRLREQIIALGGQFIYQATLCALIISRGALVGLQWRDSAGQRQETEADLAVLAIGNSARPLYYALAEQGIAMEAKPFAVGLRIRQQQPLIDRAQYGAFAGHPLLGAADYQLTWHDQGSGRGCYTFCNCPGGYIINASSEPGALAVNGMSLAARDSGFANSALVVQVFPGRDFGRDALAGVEYQYQLERAAYAYGAGALPLMSAAAFLDQSEQAEPEPGGLLSAATCQAELRGLFSEELTAALQGALRHWQRQVQGFTDQAILAAVESRTSAPLRLLRDAQGVSLNCRGLYPAGEGAGYAGGIVSSAIDGLKAAESMIEQC